MVMIKNMIEDVGDTSELYIDEDYTIINNNFFFSKILIFPLI